MASSRRFAQSSSRIGESTGMRAFAFSGEKSFIMRRLVIVTGLSGAGKSQAMKSFEDLGFACLDNLPPVLSAQFVELVERAKIDRAAVSLDVRTLGPFGDALASIEALSASGEKPELLFLDADAE